MATTAAAAGTAPALNIKDYFDAAKDGSRKTSVTADGKLASAVKEKAHGALGKDDFLSLLVTQLQYQDPTAPSDNQQMAAQMAQFSSLESMQNIQKSIDGMNSSLSNLSGTQTGAANSMSGAAASSLLGRTVSIRQDSVGIVSGRVSSLQVQGGEGSTMVLKDSTGKVVKTVPFSGANADGSAILGSDGRGVVKLDPVGDQGQPLAGKYSIEVVGADGKPNGYAYKDGEVKGLRFEEGAPYLTLSTGSYKMSDLIAVQEAPAASAATAAATAPQAAAGTADLSSGALASSLLGRQVGVKEENVSFSGDGSRTYDVQAEPGSRLELSDPSGRVVRTVPLDGSGKVSLSAADAQGIPLSGTFTATVRNASGAVSGSLVSRGTVSSIEFRDGAAMLSVNGTAHRMGDLLSVSSPAAPATLPTTLV